MMTDKNKPKTRKDRIMDAALRIFAEKGFQNATITEISKEAGVSEATIYEYFGTKEDLLFAIPEKITNETFEKSSKVIRHIAVLCTALSIEPPLFRLGFASTHVEQEISPNARPCRNTPVGSCAFGLY
jgi:AcrR family transcriptional regulator